MAAPMRPPPITPRSPTRRRSSARRRPRPGRWPTPSAPWPSTRSRPPNPAIPACRWAWPTSPPRCGRRFLKFDAADPRWPDRDRFVLSAGHGSMLLYALLLPHRPRRHGHRGDQALPPAAFPRRRPSGIRRAPGDRDHHRPARPGLRHRGRHGAGRTPAGGAVRQVAGRSPHLGDRLGRRPDGGHQPRGRRPRRPSAPVQADRAVRRQPHLDRRRHRAGVLRRRAEAVRRAMAGRPSGSTATTRRRSTRRCPSRCARRSRP